MAEPSKEEAAPSLSYRHWREGMNADECISVDGDAPGRIHLSHWPGNRTPKQFAHDLSTGSALVFARAPERHKLLQGITTVTNNHWDTDGLCAAWTVLEPEKAARHAHLLLSAAMAGDFEMFTTPEGVKIDLTLTQLTKHPYSPVFSGKFGTELECRTAQYEFGLELLPKLLENPDLHADWFARDYWTIQKDLRSLREDFNPDEGLMKSVGIGTLCVGRPYHRMAINTLLDCDMVLLCIKAEGGWMYELYHTTRTWFELPSRPRVARADWGGLATLLNARAGDSRGQWVAADVRKPAPSLMFVQPDGEQAVNPRLPDDIQALILSFYVRHIAPGRPEGAAVASGPAA